MLTDPMPSRARGPAHTTDSTANILEEFMEEVVNIPEELRQTRWDPQTPRK